MLYKQLICGITATAILSISFTIKANELPIPRTPLHQITPETLATDYASERAYRPEGHKQPVIGLAMSGGGTKAAMFSHGVLHGLHDSGVLDHVDAISTVSGGSYAAYWYFTKQLESKREQFNVSQIFDDCVPTYWTKDDTDIDLISAMQAAKERPPKAGMLECDGPSHFRAKGETRLDDPYRWQAHIVRWPDVIQPSPIFLDGGKQSSPERQMEIGIAKALTKEVLSHPFGGKSAVPRIYQYGIERTWGLNPKPRNLNTLADRDEKKHWQYSNDGVPDADVARKGIRVNPLFSSWAQLRELYTPPSASSTTTTMPLWILNSTDGKKTWGPNTDKIFEITPFGYGSFGTGYFNDPETILISDLGTSVRASAGFADAQGIETKWAQFLMDKSSDLIPALRWGVDSNIVSWKGKKDEIHLSDGGGSENLGLYSLLKRGLEDIIVVDTAADVEGDMSDICAVRNALKTKDNVTLEFKALQNLEEVCAGQPRKKAKRVYNVSAWKNPVVKGTVTWPPVNGSTQRITNIWLVKAAWDEKAVVAAYSHKPIKCGLPNQLNCLLAVFYGHNRGIQGKDGYMLFPQLGTVGTTYNSSSYLFWGYRELGRMLASNLSVNASGRIELKSPQCLQVDLKRIPNRRPELYKKAPLTECNVVPES